jgi:hypothetical protein
MISPVRFRRPALALLALSAAACAGVSRSVPFLNARKEPPQDVRARVIGPDVLVAWNSPCDYERIDVQVLRAGTVVSREQAAAGAGHLLFEDLEPGFEYQFELWATRGTLLDPVRSNPVLLRPQRELIRFPTREDLGLREPLPLPVVYCFSEGIEFDARKYRFGVAPGDFDARTAFENTTRDVLELCFSRAIRVGREDYRLIERERKLFRESGEPDALRSNPVYGAPALVEVDFRPPRAEAGADPLPSKLVLRLYDISSGDPLLPGEVRYWNLRPLIFEDYEEVVGADEDLGFPEEFPRRLLEAWERLLARLRTSSRFQDYLDLASVILPIHENPDERALVLLGVVPPRIREQSRGAAVEASDAYRWITEQMLFASARPEAPRPGPEAPEDELGQEILELGIPVDEPRDAAPAADEDVIAEQPPRPDPGRDAAEEDGAPPFGPEDGRH